jgi:hypothetical protein
MRFVLAALLLAGCQNVGELLAPDELHAFYGEGSASSAGSIERPRGDPWGLATGSDTDSDYWTVGLTWNLLWGPSEAERTREALREATRAMALAAERLPQAAPVAPVVVAGAPAPSVSVTVDAASQAGAEAASEATGAEPAEPAGSEPEDPPSGDPQGVELLGVSGQVWTQLLVALGALATAVAGYLGRRHLPVVGKAVRAREERKAAENGN